MFSFRRRQPLERLPRKKRKTKVTCTEQFLFLRISILHNKPTLANLMFLHRLCSRQMACTCTKQFSQTTSEFPRVSCIRTAAGGNFDKERCKTLRQDYAKVAQGTLSV